MIEYCFFNQVFTKVMRDVLMGSNSSTSKLQPYSGCIIRSPCRVDNNIFRLCSISSSSLTISTLQGFGKRWRKGPANTQNRFFASMFRFYFYPPIITVVLPTVMVPPCAVVSPIRAAGIPPIKTVAEPLVILSGGPTQVNKFPCVLLAALQLKLLHIPAG